MKPMKTLTIGTTTYEVVDKVAREQAGSGGGGSAEYNRINVRDYGAVGDGVTDDRAAIITAFDKAKTMLPCEVYFPAGTYGIGNGITVEMEYGTGGLLVRGAGRDITTIKYLESYDPNQPGNMWYAIRIWPVGRPNTAPATEDEYLHDISITGLSVYDTDPVAHAWNTANGDPSTEETHGFDIHYCKRVSVTDCSILNVGDEGVDIYSCRDVIVANNHLAGSPAAGASGGAISIGDGSVGVLVSGNTVNGRLLDGVVNNPKGNFGIAVESLKIPVRDVVIEGNIVRNVQGNGINIAATNAGSGLYNINITDNLIQGCNNGIRDEGTHPRDGVKISGNTFVDCVVDETIGSDLSGFAITLNYPYTALLVQGNTIRNTHGNYAVRLNCGDNPVLFSDNVLENIGKAAMYTGTNVIVRDCVITNTGVEDATSTAAIIPATATCKLRVYGCQMTGVRQTRAIHNATEVEDTAMELVGADGNRVTDANVLGGNLLERVVNCRFDGNITIAKDNALVQGNTITSSQGWAHAIAVNASGVMVSGCHITQTDVSKGKRAIGENTGKNHNLFIGNVCNTEIVTVGDKTVSANNINTSAATT